MSENGDIDALAAEYVLGTLDAGERARAQSLLPADQALAAKVRIWERRLSELHLMVEPVEPDGDVWDRIKAKVQPAARAFAVPVPQPIVESPRPAVETPKSAAELLQPFAESPKPAVEEAEHKAEPVPDAATSEGVEVAKSPESSLESVDVMKSAESAERDAFARVDDSIEVARALDEAVKSIGIGRSSESVELKAAATVTETPDDEPTPSGVFDDMPEPTPSGPLASFPTSFTDLSARARAGGATTRLADGPDSLARGTAWSVTGRAAERAPQAGGGPAAQPVVVTHDRDADDIDPGCGSSAGCRVALRAGSCAAAATAGAGATCPGNCDARDGGRTGAA